MIILKLNQIVNIYLYSHTMIANNKVIIFNLIVLLWNKTILSNMVYFINLYNKTEYCYLIFDIYCDFLWMILSLADFVKIKKKDYKL